MKFLKIWSYPCPIDSNHWFTCSFSQLLCESAKSNLILRSQGLAHWKHSKILCWTYEWRTCYFAGRLYIAGLAMLGYVLSTLHWEAVLCSEKLLALQARKPRLPQQFCPLLPVCPWAVHNLKTPARWEEWAEEYSPYRIIVRIVDNWGRSFRSSIQHIVDEFIISWLLVTCLYNRNHNCRGRPSPRKCSSQSCCKRSSLETSSPLPTSVGGLRLASPGFRGFRGSIGLGVPPALKQVKGLRDYYCQALVQLHVH